MFAALQNQMPVPLERAYDPSDGVAGALAHVTSSPEALRQVQRPDIMHKIGSELECLRGAARGTTAKTQKVLFGMFAGLLQPLLALLDAYHQYENMTVLILKLASELVDGHVSYLKVNATPHGVYHFMYRPLLSQCKYVQRGSELLLWGCCTPCHSYKSKVVSVNSMTVSRLKVDHRSWMVQPYAFNHRALPSTGLAPVSCAQCCTA